MISDVIDELKNSFHLKKNHAIILSFLSEEACTADEICERTTIPKGRVYSLLNELINMQLIDRESGVPAIYSMKNPSDKILDFLSYEFASEANKKTRILSMLEEGTKVERIALIDTNDKYDYEKISLLAGAKHIREVLRNLSISWLLHPKDENEFWKVRQEINKQRRASTSPTKKISILKYRAYWEVFREKPIEEIMTKEALDFYVSIIKSLYGEQHIKQWALEVIGDLKKHTNVKIYILDTQVPVFTTIISNNSVISVMVSRGELTGIKILGTRTAALYQKYFEEIKSNAKPIQEYLGEYLV